MEPTEKMKEVVDGYGSMRRRQQGLSEMERREVRQALQKKSRETIVELTLNWLQHAADPKNSAFEKWGLFWENVFVVTAQKVKTQPYSINTN